MQALLTIPFQGETNVLVSLLNRAMISTLFAYPLHVISQKYQVMTLLDPEMATTAAVGPMPILHDLVIDRILTKDGVMGLLPSHMASSLGMSGLYAFLFTFTYEHGKHLWNRWSPAKTFTRLIILATLSGALATLIVHPASVLAALWTQAEEIVRTKTNGNSTDPIQFNDATLRALGEIDLRSSKSSDAVALLDQVIYAIQGFLARHQHIWRLWRGVSASLPLAVIIGFQVALADYATFWAKKLWADSRPVESAPGRHTPPEFWPVMARLGSIAGARHRANRSKSRSSASDRRGRASGRTSVGRASGSASISRASRRASIGPLSAAPVRLPPWVQLMITIGTKWITTLIFYPLMLVHARLHICHHPQYQPDPSADEKKSVDDKGKQVETVVDPNLAHGPLAPFDTDPGLTLFSELADVWEKEGLAGLYRGHSFKQLQMALYSIVAILLKLLLIRYLA